jgi:hypothetical protein
MQESVIKFEILCCWVLFLLICVVVDFIVVVVVVCKICVHISEKDTQETNNSIQSSRHR